MIARYVMAALLLLASGIRTWAQTTPPPAPLSDDVIQPDQAGVTNSTHIVSTGLVQIELGGLFVRVGPTQHAAGSPMAMRVGLADWIEARVSTDGIVSHTNGGGSATGLGNVQLGAKLRLWANGDGIPVLAIEPMVNLPTASASKGLGSGTADYTLVLLTGTDVGARGHVDINYGVGLIGAGAAQPHFTEHLTSVSASLAASDRWNPYSDFFWFSKNDPTGGAVTGFDAGTVYTLNPRLAFDGGLEAQFGGVQSLTAFGGVSFVVGKVPAGDHGVHARHRKADRRAPARHR